jgi:hypothetical protein
MNTSIETKILELVDKVVDEKWDSFSQDNDQFVLSPQELLAFAKEVGKVAVENMPNALFFDKNLSDAEKLLVHSIVGQEEAQRIKLIEAIDSIKLPDLTNHI